MTRTLREDSNIITNKIAKPKVFVWVFSTITELGEMMIGASDNGRKINFWSTNK